VKKKAGMMYEAVVTAFDCVLMRATVAGACPPLALQITFKFAFAFGLNVEKMKESRRRWKKKSRRQNG
jgi:hypothetical protein